MGKFRFETLLKLREATRDEKKNALLDAEQRRKNTSDELVKLDQEILRERETLRRARGNDTIPKEELLFSQELRIRLFSKRREIQGRLSALVEEVENKRHEFNAAIREVKILQNLKDKIEDREMEEAKRLAKKTMDELTTSHKARERRQKEDEGDT